MKELVQQQRSELYAAGHQNLNMAISEATVAAIDEMKRRYRLRSRDAVVGRVIRRALATVDPDSVVLRASDPDTTYRRISPIVAGELADFVKRVQRRFRNLGYGPVFEMILDEVGTNLNPGVQFELIRRDVP